MPFIILVVVVLTYMAMGNNDLGKSGQDDRRAQALASAELMTWYHTHAIRACGSPATCSTGEIAVSQTPLNPSINMASTFQSVRDGNYVITSWRNAPSNVDGRSMSGMIGSALGTITWGSTYAGTYNAATGRISASQAASTQTLTIVTNTTVFPSVVGGMTLRDGSPIVATRVN